MCRRAFSASDSWEADLTELKEAVMRLEAHYVTADASKVALRHTVPWFSAVAVSRHSEKLQSAPACMWEARHLDKTDAKESCWAAEKAVDQTD